MIGLLVFLNSSHGGINAGFGLNYFTKHEDNVRRDLSLKVRYWPQEVVFSFDPFLFGFEMPCCVQVSSGNVDLTMSNDTSTPSQPNPTVVKLQ